MTASVLGELTADRRSIVLMASGADHELVEATKRLQTLTPRIKPTDPPGGLLLPASWAAVVQLAATFGAWWRPGPALTTWIRDQLLQRTAIGADAGLPDGADPGRLTVAPPRGLVPRPYQVANARAIGQLGSVILGDEPGVGKSVSTLLGIVERAAAGHAVLPIVIVCPNAVVDHWVEHVAAWAPYWRAVAWRGSPKRRRRLIGTADVYVATYGLARSDAGTADLREIARGKSPLLELAPRFLVVDEAHKIADPASGQSRAVRKIAARVAAADGSSVALSGTLIKQTPKDLWPSLYAIAPDAFPSSERWVARYCDTVAGEYQDTVIGLNVRAEPEFRETIRGQFRRVAKADVLADLPPKVYSVRTVDIPEAWRKAYDAIESQMLADLPSLEDGSGGGELEAMGVLAQLTRLLQLASAAADVVTTEEVYLDAATGAQMVKKHQAVTLKAPSWKVDAALEVMAERPGQQFVAAAPSRQLVVLMGEAAAAAGYRVAYLVGGQGAAARSEQIAGFQDGRYDLICVTTGAGGTGVTLTAASCLIFLQRPWSFVDASQMEDRCFGAGTPVLTPDGWRPIEDVQVGDRVITHTGGVQAVIDAWSQQAKSVMAEVSITGQSTVTCTADHRFLLADGQWREAGDLQPGDWLAMPGNHVGDELTAIPFVAPRVSQVFTNQWGNPQVNTRLKRADTVIAVSDDFLFALGYFAGDGFASVNDDKGRFVSFSGNQDTKVAALDRCARWAASVGLKGTRRAASQGAGAEQRFYGADWAWWFREHFGGQTGAAHKQLPAFVLALNPRQTQVVLDGLVASDGYRRDGKPRCEYVTVSPVLASQVVHLASRAGHRPSHCIGSTGQHVIGFAGTQGPRTAGRVRSVLRRHPAKPGGVRERVYDITVKGDETFVVGGVVVHNCHRIGSERHASVEVIDIVTTKSIESRVRALLKGKAQHLSDFVEDPRIVAELLGGAGVRDLRKASRGAAA